MYTITERAHNYCMLVPEYQGYVWDPYETDLDWWTLRLWIVRN